MARLPAQLRADPAGIDRVAPVVAGAVGDRGDQAAVGGVRGEQLIEHVADRLHHLLVGALAMAPHAVRPSRGALGGGQQQGIHVVFHIQPVAHIEAIAIERDGFARRRLEDHHRDQLR